jgi:FkbM family methyltransferase
MSFIQRIARSVIGAGRQASCELAVAAPRSFEEQIYAAAVTEGDVCFDVGANLGEVALFLARQTGPEGIVVAFEPVLPVFCDLCHTVQSAVDARAAVVTMPAGLAEAEKVASIQMPRGMFGLGSLAEPAEWSRIHQAAEIVCYECRFTTLDHFVQGSGVAQPDFMKIDVEGAELLVLQGGSAMFAAGHRPLMLIELFAPWERAFGYGPWQVLSLLAGYGYEFLFACPQGLIEYRPVPDAPCPREFAQGYNMLAYCSERHHARIAALGGLRVGGLTPRLHMTPPPVPNVP